jgi:cytidylate kinase
MNQDTKKTPVVTIDGPAGSGKGTISQRVADELGWNILDSGALYRLVALAAQRKGIELEDDMAESNLSEVAKQLDVVFKPCEGGGVEVLLEKDDVTHAIRSEECGCSASKVAAQKGVRSALLDRQRRFLSAPGLVADGRDMGTVVFPQADVKVFLTASAEIRAQRRQNQLKERGIDANLRGLIHDIEERDARDTNRKDAPLIPADDAIIIDTGKLSIDEVVSKVMKKVNASF